MRLLFNLTNLRGKAILLTLIHGIRVGEASQLKVEDVKLREKRMKPTQEEIRHEFSELS